MCPWYFALLHLVDGICTSGKITQFWGHLLAIWLKCIIVWRVSCPDLFWTICHLNVSLVLYSITFGWWHIHKWKNYTISGPFTCRLTRMYSSMKNKFLCHLSCFTAQRTLEHFSCFVANFHFMCLRLRRLYMEFSFSLSYNVCLISSKYLFGICKHFWCFKLHANFGAWRNFCCVGSPGVFITPGTYHV